MGEPLHLSFQQVLGKLTLVPVVAAGIIALVRFRYLPPNLRYLAALAWFELPLEAMGDLIVRLHGNNLFLMPVYTIGEFGLLALLYRQTLQSAAFTRLLPWIVGGFTAYVLFDSLLAPNLKWFRPGQQVAQSVLILAMVGWYFRKLLNELQVQRLAREPMFWVSVGLFLYFLGYLQIALFSNYLLHHYSLKLNLNIWTINSLLHIVLHSCYCLALWMRPQK